MYPLRQVKPLAAAIALTSALMLNGCAATSVNSYLASNADVSRYHTYDWAAPDRFETGDPRLDNNPFFQERVEQAVEAQLTSRGLERVKSSPELVLHYHASIKQRVNANHADEEYGYCTDCTPYVYDAGTLVIDLVDARTQKLVWRGWAEGSVDGAIDDQRAMEAQIDRAVARILTKLPRLT
jgi:hypothetical protein